MTDRDRPSPVEAEESKTARGASGEEGRPRLLDLFCGAGGATRGYQDAGFYVVGMDIEPQPHYCGDEFVQMDALEMLRGNEMFSWEDWIDAIHASPPCQAFTQMSAKYRGRGGAADSHVNLLTPILDLLRPMEIPWVVENVQGAKHMMNTTLKLHGGMFGLGVHRPRLFESNVMLLAPTAAQCREPIGVYGDRPDGRRLWTRTRNNGNYKTAKVPKKSIMRAPRTLEEAQEAMGMDWADWHGTKEAVPPAYCEFIGAQLRQHLKAEAAWTN